MTSKTTGPATAERTTPATADGCWVQTSDGRGYASITCRADRDLSVTRSPCSGRWRFVSTDTELPVTSAQIRELADRMDAGDVDAWRDAEPQGDAERPAASGSDR